MFIFNLLNDQFSKPISHLLTRKLHSQKKSLQVNFNLNLFDTNFFLLSESRTTKIRKGIIRFTQAGGKSSRFIFYLREMSAP